MNTIRIIITAIILTTVLLACEDKTVYHDRMEEPVKSTGIDAKLGDVFAMPDGRAAALVKTDGERIDDEEQYAIAVIDKNGNYKLSETFPLISEEYLKIYNPKATNQLYISSSGKLFFKQHLSNCDTEKIIKLNKDGEIEYDGYHNNYYRYYDNDYYFLATILDNEEIALLKIESNANDNGDTYKKDNLSTNCTLMYGKSTDWKKDGLTYDIYTNSKYFCTNAVSVENKIVLYDEYYSDKEGICRLYYDNDDDYKEVKLYNDKPNQYYIINTDGSIANSGKCELPIIYIKYVDGYIYFITSNIAYGNPPEKDQDGNNVHQWVITKMDTSGNEISSFTIKTYSLLENINIENGTLMIPGLVMKGNGQKNGAIFLIDDNSGTFIEKIVLNYDQCAVIPCVISPDFKGGYNIFAIIQNNYDDVTNSNTDTDSGKLFIYHTDDLHQLQIK